MSDERYPFPVLNMNYSLSYTNYRDLTNLLTYEISNSVLKMRIYIWIINCGPSTRMNVPVNSPILFLKTNITIIITFPISPIGIGTNDFNVFPSYVVVICG